MIGNSRDCRLRRMSAQNGNRAAFCSLLEAFCYMVSNKTSSTHNEHGAESGSRICHLVGPCKESRVKSNVEDMDRKADDTRQLGRDMLYLWPE